MKLEIIPEKLTKRKLFEIYHPMSHKYIREAINYHIKEIGKNPRLRNIPEWAVLNFIIAHGIPDGYTLSENQKNKIIKLNEIRGKSVKVNL